VRFAEMIEAMFARGIRTFVEVGAGAVLSGLVEQCLEGRPHRAIAFDRKGQHGVVGLWQGLGRLAVAGVSLNFSALWAGFRPNLDDATAPGGFAMSINGGNYGRPYPPKGGAAALPKPNPPRPQISNPMHENDKNPPAPSPAPLRPQPTPVAPTVPLAAAPAAASDALVAYEAYQKALSDGHQKYLQAMETTLGDGHKQYLRSMESSFVSLCAALTGQPLPEAVSVPLTAPSPAVVAMPAPPAVVAPYVPAPAPVAIPEPVPPPAPQRAVERPKVWRLWNALSIQFGNNRATDRTECN
jgi:acyl transferase domain-containing protein